MKNVIFILSFLVFTSAYAENKEKFFIVFGSNPQFIIEDIEKYKLDRLGINEKNFLTISLENTWGDFSRSRSFDMQNHASGEEFVEKSHTCGDLLKDNHVWENALSKIPAGTNELVLIDVSGDYCILSQFIRNQNTNVAILNEWLEHQVHKEKPVDIRLWLSLSNINYFDGSKLADIENEFIFRINSKNKTVASGDLDRIY